MQASEQQQQTAQLVTPPLEASAAPPPGAIPLTTDSAAALNSSSASNAVSGSPLRSALTRHFIVSPGPWGDDSLDGAGSLLDAAIDTLRAIAAATADESDTAAPVYGSSGLQPLHTIRSALAWASSHDDTHAPASDSLTLGPPVVPWRAPVAAVPVPEAPAPGEGYSHGGYTDGYAPASAETESSPLLSSIEQPQTPASVEATAAAAAATLTPQAAPAPQLRASPSENGLSAIPAAARHGAAPTTTNRFRRNRWYIAAAAATEGIIASPHIRRVHARAAYSRATGGLANDPAGSVEGPLVGATGESAAPEAPALPSPLRSPIGRAVPSARGLSSPAAVGRRERPAASPTPAGLQTPAARAPPAGLPGVEGDGARQALWPVDLAEHPTSAAAPPPRTAGGASVNSGRTRAASMAHAPAARMGSVRYGGQRQAPRAGTAATPTALGASVSLRGSFGRASGAGSADSEQQRAGAIPRYGKVAAVRKRGYALAPAPPPPLPPATPAATEARLAGALAAATTGSAAALLLRAGAPPRHGPSRPATLPPASSSSACLCMAGTLGVGAAARVCVDCGAAFGVAHMRWRHEHCDCCAGLFCADCIAAAHPLLAAPVPLASAAAAAPAPVPRPPLRLCAGCAFSVGATDLARGDAVAAASQAALGTASLWSPELPRFDGGWGGHRRRRGVAGEEAGLGADETAPEGQEVTPEDEVGQTPAAAASALASATPLGAGGVDSDGDRFMAALGCLETPSPASVIPA